MQRSIILKVPTDLLLSGRSLGVMSLYGIRAAFHHIQPPSNVVTNVQQTSILREPDGVLPVTKS